MGIDCKLYLYGRVSILAHNHYSAKKKISVVLFIYFYNRLGSVCSHAAALLFKLQACSQLELNKEACTSKLCAWKKSRKNAAPAPLVKINFKRPKKDDLLPQIDDTTGEFRPFSAIDPTRSCTSFFKEKLQELKTIAPKAAVFTSTTLLDEECSDRDTSATDTADEDERTIIPEPLSSLFEYRAINFNDEELNNHCEKVYNEYNKNYTKNDFYNLEQITKKQADSDVWKIHRIGRITASIAKMAYHTDITNPSKTFINTIMNYNTTVEVAATKYGKRMEKNAQRDFFQVFQKTHENATFTATGLYINKDFLFLGASPDGTLSCKCHGKSCLEIKCPFKYKDGLEGWSSDKNFPISPDGLINKKHAYYYQMQLQMLVTATKNCYFFIWSKPSQKNQAPNNYLLLQVGFNEDFCKSMHEKFEKLFIRVILPELITRKTDPNNEETEKFFCICRRPSFPPMIACDGKNCKIEWFHYSCVKVVKAPKHKWYCPECKYKN